MWFSLHLPHLPFFCPSLFLRHADEQEAEEKSQDEKEQKEGGRCGMQKSPRQHKSTSYSNTFPFLPPERKSRMCTNGKSLILEGKRRNSVCSIASKEKQPRCNKKKLFLFVAN